MENYFEFGNSFMNGAIINSNLLRGINLEDPLIVSLMCGLVGTLIACFVSYKVAIISIKIEKKYYIELEVLTEKIFNPLFKIYYRIKDRESLNLNEIFIDDIYDEIDAIFDMNTCWYFVSNKHIKPYLTKIRKYSKNKQSDELWIEMKLFYDEIEKVYVKKYK